jgi:hypothetical protein
MSEPDPMGFARAVCGARIVPGPELLDPEIEALACDAFRRLAEYFEALAQQAREKRARA